MLMFNTPAYVSWKAGVRYTAVPGGDRAGLHQPSISHPPPRVALTASSHINLHRTLDTANPVSCLSNLSAPVLARHYLLHISFDSQFLSAA